MHSLPHTSDFTPGILLTHSLSGSGARMLGRRRERLPKMSGSVLPQLSLPSIFAAHLRSTQLPAKLEEEPGAPRLDKTPSAKVQRHLSNASSTQGSRLRSALAALVPCTSEAEKQALQDEIDNLRDELRELKKKERESRPEDLAQMQAMEAYYKVELRNREENYNQLFDAFATCSPSPGLLDHDVGAYMSAWTSQSPTQSTALSRASSPFSLLGQVSADDE